MKEFRILSEWVILIFLFALIYLLIEQLIFHFTKEPNYFYIIGFLVGWFSLLLYEKLRKTLWGFK